MHPRDSHMAWRWTLQANWQAQPTRTVAIVHVKHICIVEARTLNLVTAEAQKHAGSAWRSDCDVKATLWSRTEDHARSVMEGGGKKSTACVLRFLAGLACSMRKHAYLVNMLPSSC